MKILLDLVKERHGNTLPERLEGLVNTVEYQAVEALFFLNSQ